MIRQAIEKLVTGTDLSAEESRQTLEEIMTGQTDAALVEEFLTALSSKGETEAEILGAAQTLREHSIKIPHRQEKLFDCCGTGGDGAQTFNISTTMALVVAGTGVAVGKHGNRSVSSKSGSADFLEAAGVKLELSPEKVGKCIDEIGIGFIYAPVFHPAMKTLAAVRKKMRIRTIFNILGPLCNPAGPTHQLIGVWEENLTEKIARVCSKLGTNKCWVVHGGSGIDELITFASNQVSACSNGTIETFRLDPQEFNFLPADNLSLKSENVDASLNTVYRVLAGEKCAARDTVILNSAAALVVAEKTARLEEGIELAQESIDSGKARLKLKQLEEFSQKC
ncbi:MAG: anthranilate phosphoribosyltransferase [candidate division Zixibacteria bacterium]|nr:anthranilate phosphoribosyltransferase [candidate division Zixibacteria bacterium]